MTKRGRRTGVGGSFRCDHTARHVGSIANFEIEARKEIALPWVVSRYSRPAVERKVKCDARELRADMRRAATRHLPADRLRSKSWNDFARADAPPLDLLFYGV